MLSLSKHQDLSKSEFVISNENGSNSMVSRIDAHAMAKNTFLKDFSVRKCLTIIVTKKCLLVNGVFFSSFYSGFMPCLITFFQEEKNGIVKHFRVDEEPDFRKVQFSLRSIGKTRRETGCVRKCLRSGKQVTEIPPVCRRNHF